MDKITDIYNQVKYWIKHETNIKDAIKLYTRGAKMNDRANHSIYKLFSLLPPLKKPIVVYRGVTNFEEKINYIEDKFVSVSLDKRVALDFRGEHCCVLNITIPVGTRIIPILQLSEHPTEDEILLVPDATWEIFPSQIKSERNVVYTPKFSIKIEHKINVNRLKLGFFKNKMTILLNVFEPDKFNNNPEAYLEDIVKLTGIDVDRYAAHKFLSTYLEDGKKDYNLGLTKYDIMEEIRKDPNIIRDIEQKPEYVFAAVNKSGYTIRWVRDQKPEYVFAALKQNPRAFRYVKDQKKPEYIFAILKQNGLMLQIIPTQNPEYVFAAIQQNPDALMYVKDRRPEYIEAAKKRKQQL